MRKLAYIVLLSALSGPVWAQGVPIFDQDAWLRFQAIIDQGEKDLALQQEKLNSAAELKRLKEEQLATLQEIIDATTDYSGDDTSAMVEDLEGEAGEATAADDIYGAADPNPAAAQMFGDTGTDPNAATTFGDAGNNIETLIIQVAKETHGLPGVSKAGLSVVQWRCLLQALIWQESRFTIGAKSPVGAFGLTQIMPGTAQDLGIYPDYYDSPYPLVIAGIFSTIIGIAQQMIVQLGDASTAESIGALVPFFIMLAISGFLMAATPFIVRGLSGAVTMHTATAAAAIGGAVAGAGFSRGLAGAPKNAARPTNAERAGQTTRQMAALPLTASKSAGQMAMRMVERAKRLKETR